MKVVAGLTISAVTLTAVMPILVPVWFYGAWLSMRDGSWKGVFR